MRFKTEKNKTGVTILDCIDAVGNKLIIPSRIDGLHVTSIGNDFLCYNRSLTTIKLPNSLTSIGINFLCNNKSLTTIKLPNSLTSIGYNFLRCNKSLTTIKLPNSLTSIGNDFLCDNKSLTTIKLPNSLTSIGNNFLCCNESLTTIKIKNKMYKIKNVDNCLMIIHSKKKRDDYIIYSCKFLTNMKKSIVVEKNNIYSHGETVKKAMQDLSFKISQKDFNVDDLVIRIKKLNKIKINDYRLLTGACREGVRQFMLNNNLNKDYLTIDKCLELTKGNYGHETIKELLK